MNAEQLHEFIVMKDKAHRDEQRRLKALLRCLPGGAKLLEKPAS